MLANQIQRQVTLKCLQGRLFEGQQEDGHQVWSLGVLASQTQHQGTLGRSVRVCKDMSLKDNKEMALRYDLPKQQPHQGNHGLKWKQLKTIIHPEPLMRPWCSWLFSIATVRTPSGTWAISPSWRPRSNERRHVHVRRLNLRRDHLSNHSRVEKPVHASRGNVLGITHPTIWVIVEISFAWPLRSSLAL